MSTGQDRLLIAALEALRLAVSNQTAAAAFNAAKYRDGGDPGDRENRAAHQGRRDRGERVGRYQSDVDYAAPVGQGGRPGDRKRDDGGKQNTLGTNLTRAILEPFTQLVRLLGPISVVSQIIGSNATGFQVVSSAMKLLGATLGPVLLPFVILFAAGLASVSDIIWGKVAPSLESWYKYIGEVAVPAFEKLVQAVQDFVDWVARNNPAKVAEDVGDNSGGKAAHILDRMAEDLNVLFGVIDRPAPIEEAYRKRDGGGTGAGASGAGVGDFGGDGAAPGGGLAASLGKAAKPPEGASLFGANLKDAIKEFKMSIGPQASFTGLAERSRQSQLAALNQSPFEAKMLDRMLYAAGKLEAIEQNTKKPAEGRYSGDS